MTRIIGDLRLVHFRNPAVTTRTLCGVPATVDTTDLIGIKREPFPVTSKSVTCTACARVYCAVKNEPWNAVRDDAMDIGIRLAVRPDGYEYKNEESK